MVRRLIIANAVVFGAIFLLYLATNREVVHSVQEWFGITPGLWVEWLPLVPVWQLFTWGFLHSLEDPFHLLGNMLFLYFLGTMLEGLVGSRRFLVTFASGLLVAGIATLLVGFLTVGDQAPGRYVTTLGASGAVLCIVVAMAVLRPDTRLIFIIFPITLRTLAIAYVGLNLFYFLLQIKGAGGDNVAYLAHLVGAGWGFLLAKRGWIWKDPLEKVEEWREDRDQARAADDERRVDDLLAKINREGIQSLTSRERAFLKRASKKR